ncbi:MAG: hypothetical protein PHX76_02975 [Patescibacteria group bacterium]|jgi:hypothetical protein|nr:hypothetical protein [Patescibacteria group bacterium]MDD3939549.1 hypothetical protein [Patescibacteria group bacterium]MDD4444066.1 hypothetical protein [Patescibacteria group bacterium]NCU40075.1 hypothetical protein [Candidatus Falkowbacteria bacterium]
MCKKGIAVNYRNEAGRIENIRVKIEKNQEKIVVGNFTGRNSSTSHVVSFSEVMPANNKAAKNLAKEMEKLNIKSAKNGD